MAKAKKAPKAAAKSKPAKGKPVKFPSVQVSFTEEAPGGGKVTHKQRI